VNLDESVLYACVRPWQLAENRPLGEVVSSSSPRPSFSRSPPVFVARQADRAPIMGCPILFPIEREHPQFYTLNFGPSGLESLPATHRSHRHCRYSLIVNRNTNSKQCCHRGGCYDKCAVSTLSRLVSTSVGLKDRRGGDEYKELHESRQWFAL
jgi:hypothetical protein